VVFPNSFAISIEFTSALLGAKWIRTNVYAPCNTQDRQDFLHWFKSVDMPDTTDCLVTGDFNLMRRQSDRNKSLGNVQDMLNFNDVISCLRLEELKLVGNKYTWINKQESPLLERLG
jgi:hypothetical protein